MKRYSVLLLLAFASLAFANHQLSCPTNPTCPESNFMFVCTTGDVLGELMWIVKDARGVPVANYTVDNETALTDDMFGGNNQFSVRRIGDNSTRLQFMANPNYNGYSVDCVDDDDGVMTCLVAVVGPPPAPENFNIMVDTQNQTLTWQQPANYACNISGYALYAGSLPNPVNFSANTNMLRAPITVGQMYTYQISAVDSAGRIGSRSTVLNISANAPPQVVIDRPQYTYGNSDAVGVRISFTVPSTNTPDVQNFYVSYNVTRGMDTGSGSGDGNDQQVIMEVAVPGSQTQVQIQGMFIIGGTYFVQVIPSNIFGNGTLAKRVFTIPPRPTTQPPTTRTDTPSTTMTPSSTGGSPGLSTGAIVGIVVGSIVGILLIVAVVVAVVIVVIFVMKGKGNKSSERELGHMGTNL